MMSLSKWAPSPKAALSCKRKQLDLRKLPLPIDVIHLIMDFAFLKITTKQKMAKKEVLAQIKISQFCYPPGHIHPLWNCSKKRTILNYQGKHGGFGCEKVWDTYFCKTCGDFQKYYKDVLDMPIKKRDVGHVIVNCKIKRFVKNKLIGKIVKCCE
jgi:hypothetical protein